MAMKLYKSFVRFVDTASDKGSEALSNVCDMSSEITFAGKNYTHYLTNHSKELLEIQEKTRATRIQNEVEGIEMECEKDHKKNLEEFFEITISSRFEYLVAEHNYWDLKGNQEMLQKTKKLIGLYNDYAKKNNLPVIDMKKTVANA